MASVEVGITDQRTVRAGVPLDSADTAKFAAAISDAAMNGYVLSAAQDITGGSQRDPYVVGVLLTFTKP